MKYISNYKSFEELKQSEPSEKIDISKVSCLHNELESFVNTLRAKIALDSNLRKDGNGK